MQETWEKTLILQKLLFDSQEYYKVLREECIRLQDNLGIFLQEVKFRWFRVVSSVLHVGRVTNFINPQKYVYISLTLHFSVSDKYPSFWVLKAEKTVSKSFEEVSGIYPCF